MENDRAARRSASDDGTSTEASHGVRRTRVLTMVAGSTLAIGLIGAGVAGAATSSSTAKTAPAAHGARGGPGGPGGPGMMQGNRGIVSAIGTGSVTITEMDGTSATFATTSSTTYRKDGSSTTSATLAVGDNIAISTSLSTSATATAIEITSPSLRGTVVSVASGTITVKDGSGFYRTVDTAGSTTFLNGGAASTIAAVTTGENVLAVGSVDADHTSLDATTVGVILPRTGGKVKSVSGSTFTITARGGSTVTVTETGSTVYRSGQTTATSSVVKVGAFVNVEGTKDASGNVTATSVGVMPTPPSGDADDAGNADSPSGSPAFGPGGPGGQGGPVGGGPGGGRGF